MNVTVPTEQAARVRIVGKSPWNGIYTLVYLFGALAFIGISIYENAWEYRSVTTSALIAFAWTAPFTAAAHLIHFITSRGRRTRTRRAINTVVERVNAAAADAGLPPLHQDSLRRMLTAKDNGPQAYTGQGKFPAQPSLAWELPTDDPAVLVAATRGGSPETVTLARSRASAPAEPSRSTTVTVLGMQPDTDVAPITASCLGGRPAVPADFVWPSCVMHRTAMQFLAQVEHEEQLLLVFLCVADPGMCDSWDPDAGCNAVVPVSGRDLHLAEPPTADAITSSEPHLLGVRTYDAESFHDAAAAASADGCIVAGQYGGTPDWFQSDETPADASTFVASLVEHPAGFNFGGGSAYIFTDGAGAAKLLLQ